MESISTKECWSGVKKQSRPSTCLILFAPMVVLLLLCIISIRLYNILHWNTHIYKALSPVHMYRYLKNKPKPDVGIFFNGASYYASQVSVFLYKYNIGLILYKFSIFNIKFSFFVTFISRVGSYVCCSWTLFLVAYPGLLILIYF